MAVGLAFAPAGVTVGDPPPPPEPDDIAGLVEWLKADAITGLSDGDSVQPWTATVGANASQGIAGRQPIWKVNIQNGLPVVRYDGTDDLNEVVITADSSQTLMFVLTKRSAATGTNRAALALGGLSRLYANTGESPSAQQWAWYSSQGGAAVASGATVTNWNIVTIKLASASSMTLYANGTETVTFDPDDQVVSSTSLVLGALNVFTEAAADVDLGEVLIYDSVLGDTDRHGVEQGLGQKWGIAVA